MLQLCQNKGSSNIKFMYEISSLKSYCSSFLDINLTFGGKCPKKPSRHMLLQESSSFAQKKLVEKDIVGRAPTSMSDCFHVNTSLLFFSICPKLLYFL